MPTQYPGTGRRVRPGAQQMADSVSADLSRHVSAQVNQLGNLVDGKEAAAEAHRQWYSELLAVIDVPAEHYLDTVHRVGMAGVPHGLRALPYASLLRGAWPDYLRNKMRQAGQVNGALLDGGQPPHNAKDWMGRCVMRSVPA
ncbi:hypothetical protein ACFQS7_29830 [Dankookia sp. GCM10030260]|uniref:hypothetical protein n=1 Tax=Dankookia sp. GCM10030260 TaxID=3273390 RepID=UPI003610CB06